MTKLTALLSASFSLACITAPSVAQTPGEEDQVVLEADVIAEEEDGTLVIATGSVEASYGERVLRADRVVYNRTTGRVRASGNVTIVDADGTQNFADEIEVDDRLTEGYAVGYGLRLPGGTGVATANSGVRQADGINALDQAVFTACEVCEEEGIRPTWALRARRAVLNQNNDIISYRDAVLEVAGIPVFYIPYFFHPDPTSGKKSGLLFPRVGVSDRVGFNYGQPYYQVISPSADLTITPTFFTKVRPLLETEYRQRFWSGAINVRGSFTFESEFDNDGERFGDEEVRGHVFGVGRFDINDTWSWGFGVERASDDLFTRRYSIDGANARRGLYDGQPLSLLSQIYTVGQTETFYSDASVLFFQDLTAESAFVAEAPLVTPLINVEKLFEFGKYGRATLEASTAALTRDSGQGIDATINPDSRRVSIGATWSTTEVLRGGFVLEPFADVRGDFYDLDEASSGEPDVTRVVGSVGAKLSWPLVRPGKAVDLIVEPTVLGAWGLSNVNDDAIPIEDSQLAEFDESSLFSSNGFNNFDLYEGDGRLSVGVTGTARLKSGQSISAIAGRRWRTRADPNFDVATNLDGTSSDWVGGLSADFGRRLRLNVRARLDEDTFQVNRVDAQAATQIWRLSGSARYFRVDEDVRPLIDEADEGVDFRGSFRLTRNYSISYGQLRDLTLENDIRRNIGITYEDNCSRFELIYQRSEVFDRTLGPNDAFFFRFSLKSLGQFGN
ncbi:MAG: LPS assembly protein LptD [Pseudomonadota bacterium]